MKLERLTIENFRCFKHYEIEPAPCITVLIGKNGAGKSSLINAIHKSLSFVFHRGKDPKKDKSINVGITSLRLERFVRSDAWMDWNAGLPASFISVHGQGTLPDNKKLDWEMQAATNTYKYKSTLYQKAFNTFMGYVERTGNYPLLAYYSDSFPHVKAKISDISVIRNYRNFGYYQWNDETACSSIWVKLYSDVWKDWFRCEQEMKRKENQLRNNDLFFYKGTLGEQEYETDKAKILKGIDELKEKSEIYQAEKDAILNRLRTFMEEDDVMQVDDLFVSSYEDKLAVGPKGVLFEELPAGYKRLLSIVMDIAYRSFILNGRTNAEPVGIVIIDEIDLHLHPSLEQDVLQRLQKTFPDIQFIVSTHSPLVITNLKLEDGKNKILKMEEGTEKPVEIPDIYGLDYNSGIKDIMGVPARNPSIDNLLDAYMFYISQKMDKQASNVYKLLQDEISDMGYLEKEIKKRKAMMKG